MKKFVLITVVEREILTEQFETFEEAHGKMMEEFCRAAGIYVEDCTEPENECDGEFGYDKWDAYVEDGPFNKSYDWRIVEIGNDASEEAAGAASSGTVCEESAKPTKAWQIPVSFEERGCVIVEAPTLSEAMRIVREDENDIPLPAERDYVDGSFCLSTEDEEVIRRCYNDGQEDCRDEMPMPPAAASEELGFIVRYAEEMRSRFTAIPTEHIQALWTAYCLHQDLEVDTRAYDDGLLRLWESFPKGSLAMSYEEFENFMAEPIC